LIGVNTAIFSPSGASAGIGFAIPVGTVLRLVPQLIEHGRPIEPGIAGAYWLSDRMARNWGLDGVVVRGVARGSQAERIGLEGIGVTRRGRYTLGDVIVSADGEPIRSVDRLRDRFESTGVGGKVVLGIEREGELRTVETTLRRVE
jgi:S1-C subfamily serine protease